MKNLLAAIVAKKAELDQLRIRAPGGTTNFDHSQDLELTYTSNAIEVNTLTAVETTMVIEQGITVGANRSRIISKPSTISRPSVMPAISHAKIPLSEMDLRNLYRLMMLRSSPDIAGRYTDHGRYVLTDRGRHSFPSPAEILALMGGFSGWLGAAPDTPETAFTAHCRLVEIRPFNDGNGRTARLLMNLLLIRADYPAVPCAPKIARLISRPCSRRRPARATAPSISFFTKGSMRLWESMSPP